MNYRCFLCFLQSDIMDVNQIFKDLGMLVHEQGEMIGKCIIGQKLCMSLSDFSFNLISTRHSACTFICPIYGIV